MFLPKQSIWFSKTLWISSKCHVFPKTVNFCLKSKPLSIQTNTQMSHLFSMSLPLLFYQKGHFQNSLLKFSMQSISIHQQQKLIPLPQQFSFAPKLTSCIIQRVSALKIHHLFSALYKRESN